MGANVRTCTEGTRENKARSVNIEISKGSERQRQNDIRYI